MTKILCSGPFVGGFVGIGGHFRSCVAASAVQADSNVTEDFIPILFNDPKLQELRASLLRGETPDACRTCYDLKGLPGSCGMQFYNERFEVDRSKFNDDGYCHSVRLETLWLAGTSKCGYACRMCTPSNSRGVLDSYHKGGIISDEEYREVKDWTKVDTITPALLSYVKLHGYDLKVVTITGGDTLMAPGLIDLLNIFAEVNPEMELNIHLNGQSVKTRGQDLIEPFSKFNNLKLHLSIDSYGEYNNYIRQNSDYEQIWAVHDAFKEALPKAKFSLCVCISNMNVLNFGLLIKDIIERRRSFTGHLLCSVVTSPTHFTPNALSRKLRRKAIGHASDVLLYLAKQNQASSVVQCSIDIANAVITSLVRLPSDEELYEECLEHLSRIDSVFYTNYRTVGIFDDVDI